MKDPQKKEILKFSIRKICSLQSSTSFNFRCQSKLNLWLNSSSIQAQPWPNPSSIFNLQFSVWNYKFAALSPAVDYCSNLFLLASLDDFLLHLLCSFIGRFSHLASSNNIIVTAYVHLELYLSINYDLFGSKIKDYTKLWQQSPHEEYLLLWPAFSFWLDLLQHHHQASTTWAFHYRNTCSLKLWYMINYDH